MKKLLSATALALVATTAPAMADTYSASSWLSATHMITVHGFENLSKNTAEATNGGVEFEVFSGGSLLPAKGTLSGVGDGVASYGSVTAAYIPADLPHDNIINDLAFVASDSLAAAFASTEIKMTHPTMLKEYQDHGVVFGIGYSTPLYHFICKGAVRSMDDLAGQKIRTAGNSHVQWVNSIGGVPVSVSAGEIYTGLQRGSIDCTMGDASFLTSSFKLQEVADSVTVLPMGTHTSGGNVLNTDMWQALSGEERRAILDNLAVALTEMQQEWEAQSIEALEVAAGNGVEAIEPTDEMASALAAFSSDFIAKLPAKSMEDRGVDDPSDLINAYLASYKKWVGLLADIDRTDRDAVLALVRGEIYDKIDENSYGL